MTDLPPVVRAALTLAAAGFKEEEIAQRLGASSRTIRRRLAEAVAALQARNLTHAVALAAANGLVSFSVEAAVQEAKEAPPAHNGRLRPRPSTIAALDTAVAAIEDGASFSEAARRAGITYQTLLNHRKNNPELQERIEAAQRARPAARRKVPIDLDALCADIAAGIPIKEHAARIGLSPSAMSIRIAADPTLRDAVARATELVRSAKVDIVLAALRNGAFVHDAAATAGISHETLRQWRKNDADLDQRIKRAIRSRHKHPWLAPLLAALADGATLKDACRAAEVTTVSVHQARRRHAEVDAQVRAAVERGRGRAHASRWRKGQRDDQARRSHNTETREWRRKAALAGFTPIVETTLLQQIRRGVSLPDAVEQVGLTQQAVFGRARWDTPWAARLDRALLRGRNPDIAHGSDHSYRKHRCRCPECREAHAKYRDGQRERA